MSIKFKIDNQIVEVAPGITVLAAAKASDIYIPALCYHPELTPYGGCRLCMVEIEGQRGYPTACTTKVEDGMVVRTQSKTLQEMRRDMMQLILSEHPSSCMICDERKDCNEYMTTIRKVGMTTGCRWCPKDKDCELQKVVEYLEIDEITFPVYYRALEPETEDPFYDRDYNLCIYCGRCVRICEEYRRSSVIALNQRGRLTTIGPAFGVSHIDGECEFCGACISVCPTGALSEKKRKWDGIPEAYHPSVCAFCGQHCEIQHVISKNRVMGIIPPGEPHTSGGELCVKGRFVLSELLNHPDRLLEPIYRFEEGEGIVSMDEAIDSAAQAIKPLQNSTAVVFISPDLRKEDMESAVEFANAAFKDVVITSSVLTKGFRAFAELAKQSIPTSKIEKSDCLISFFMNGNYGYSPTTLAIKKAASQGVPYYQIGYQKDTTTHFATEQAILDPGKAEDFIIKLTAAIKKPMGNEFIDNLAAALKSASHPVIIIGMEPSDLPYSENLAAGIKELLTKTKAKLHMPMPYANLSALLSLPNLQNKAAADEVIKKGKAVVFTLGDTPYLKSPKAQLIISLASFRPPEDFLWNVLIPINMWGEQSGTLVESNGKEIHCKNGITAPEGVLTITEILKLLSAKLKLKPVKIKTIPVSTFKEKPGLQTKPSAVSSAVASMDKLKDGKLWLVQTYNHFSYQDTDLSCVIGGIADLLPLNTLILHPDDATKLELKSGDSVQITEGKQKIILKMLIRHIPHKGFCLLYLHPDNSLFPSNPVAVTVRRSDV